MGQNGDVKSHRLVRLDIGPIFGQNIVTSQLDVVYNPLYEFRKISLNIFVTILINITQE